MNTRLKPKKDEFGYWGFVDEQDYWVINPLFEMVGYFHGKYAKGIKDGEPVFISRDGHWYDEIPWYDREEESDNSGKSPLISSWTVAAK